MPGGVPGRHDPAGHGGALPQADAFVLASRRETFGVVYIEAMAAGLPVIATACGGPEDFVREEDGFLIPRRTRRPGRGHGADDAGAGPVRRGRHRCRGAGALFPGAGGRRLTELYAQVVKRE